VDATAEILYVFATSDGSASCDHDADCTAVYRLQVDFPDGDTGSEAVVGSSTTSGTEPKPMFIGAFDSTYLASTNGTGNLWVCGNTGGEPTLYKIAIDAGVLGSVSLEPSLSTATVACSPVSDLLNPNAAEGPTEWVFASAENDGVSAGCSSGGCIFNFQDTAWYATTAYYIGQEILDSNSHIEVVTVAGTSGATEPFWNIANGGSTLDGSVTWLDQGPLSAVTPAAWQANHRYGRRAEILDPNNNIQVVSVSGTSGASIPTFNPTPGETTSDGSVTWTNVGAIATASLAVAGGSSGMVFDNTATESGTSQIYFSTLSNQVCGTSGTGGCAIQASQADLQ